MITPTAPLAITLKALILRAFSYSRHWVTQPLHPDPSQPIMKTRAVPRPWVRGATARQVENRLSRACRGSFPFIISSLDAAATARQQNRPSHMCACHARVAMRVCPCARARCLSRCRVVASFLKILKEKRKSRDSIRDSLEMACRGLTPLFCKPLENHEKRGN